MRKISDILSAPMVDPPIVPMGQSLAGVIECHYSSPRSWPKCIFFGALIFRKTRIQHRLSSPVNQPPPHRFCFIRPSYTNEGGSQTYRIWSQANLPLLQGKHTCPEILGSKFPNLKGGDLRLGFRNDGANYLWGIKCRKI